jgi:hypothetical protein
MSNTMRRTSPLPAGSPDSTPSAPAGRGLLWLAGAGIGAAVLIMIGTSLVRQDWMFPHVTMPAVGPPWELSSVRVPSGLVIVALWLAALLAAGGSSPGCWPPAGAPGRRCG